MNRLKGERQKRRTEVVAKAMVMTRKLQNGKTKADQTEKSLWQLAWSQR